MRRWNNRHDRIRVLRAAAIWKSPSALLVSKPQSVHFHFHFAIFLFSFFIAGVAPPTMTNEKCNPANGNESASKIPPDRLLVAAGRLGGRLLASVALADAGRFAAQGAQEIELGATDSAMLDDVDVINDCRVEREDAFDADAERGLTHGDRLTHSLATTRDHNPFER